MDILRTARKLEAGIARVLDGAARTAMKSGSLEPLEIVHAVVGEGRRRRFSPPAAGGTSFPSTASRCLVAAATTKRRAQWRRSSMPGRRWRRESRSVFASAGCEPSDLAVKVVYLSAAQADWTSPHWHVDFAHVASPALTESRPTAVVADQPVIELTISQWLRCAQTLLVRPGSNRSRSMRRSARRTTSVDSNQPRGLRRRVGPDQPTAYRVAMPTSTSARCRRLPGARRSQCTRHRGAAQRKGDRRAVGSPRHPPSLG